MKLLYYYKLATLISKLKNNNRFNYDFTFNNKIIQSDLDFWQIIKPYFTLYFLPEVFSYSYLNFIKTIIKTYLLQTFLNKNYKKVKSKPDKQIVNDNTILIYGIPKFFFETTIKPVADELIKNTKYSIILLVDYDIEFYEDCNNVAVINILEFLNKKNNPITKDINNYYHQIAKGIIALNNKLNGYSYLKIRLAIYLFKLKYNLTQFINIRDFAKLLAQNNIRLFISATDTDPLFRTISLEFKKNKIENLIIEQGLTAEAAIEWKMTIADYISAMGDVSIGHMINHGVPQRKIRANGHPGFDKYIIADKNIKIILNNSDNFNNRFVLFASQPYVEGSFIDANSRLIMLKSFKNIITKLKGTYFVIKPHPSENIDELKIIFKGCTNLKFASKHEDIYYLIMNCKIFITFFSTTTIQALLAKKPVINIYYLNSFPANMITQSGTTIIAQNEEDLVNKIIWLNNDENRFQYLEGIDIDRTVFLNKISCNIDGCATKRVLKYINDIIEERESNA